MSRFKKRPTIVTAERWEPGKTIPGVTLSEAMIHWSLDKTLYYISKDGHKSDLWLGAEKKPGPCPQDKRDAASANMFARGVADFKRTSTGEEYHREALQFTFWKVKSGEREPIGVDNELFLDYASISGWGEDSVGPSKVARLGNGRLVKAGEWVVLGDDPEPYSISDDIFQSVFEPVPEDASVHFAHSDLRKGTVEMFCGELSREGMKWIEYRVDAREVIEACTLAAHRVCPSCLRIHNLIDKTTEW